MSPDTPDPSTPTPDAGDKATPPTRQPADPTEGGSKGVEDPSKAAPIPPTEKPDPGLKDQPTKGADVVVDPTNPPPRKKAGDPQAPPAKTEPPASATVPEKYDLKAPDSADIDATVIERIAAHAKSRGLSQEQAQSTLELVADEVAKHNDANAAAYKAKVEEWKTFTNSDPVLGKNRDERRAAVTRGRAVLDKFGEARPDDAKELREFLDSSGFGEHRAVVRLFAWLGKAAGEGQLVTGNAADSRPKTDAEIFYGPKGVKEKETVGV